MKFVISLLNFRPGLIGGAETYLRQLTRHLVACRGSDEVVLLVFRDNAQACRVDGLEQCVIDRSDRQTIAARMLEAFTPWRDRTVERALAALKPDAVLFPQQSIYPKRVEAPAVLAVMDLQHLFYPENFALFDRLFRPAIYPFSLRKASRLIAISAFTAQTLVDRCGVDPAKISVTHLGATLPDVAGVKPDEAIPRPFLYYPAATQPHKGHDRLFRCVAALKKQGKLPHKLVLSGRQTDLWPKLQTLAAELGIAGDLVHEGFTPYTRVCSLYAAADTVVFPTRFEGFGLPVVEAVGFGKRIIASRLAVFDEIGVPAECQIDFEKPEEFLAALARPPVKALTRPLTSWSETAQQTIDLLRRAAAEKNR
ncbi:MAG: glycosyltransferase family 1 protein [Planctomycetota bacterium]|nr:glycosyltransferase family 1 protein [Planctomycetota bacterium]